MLPTLARACGVDLPELAHHTPQMDGLDVWGTLLGLKNFKHPRNDLMYWHGAKGFQAIRVGDWKLFPEAKHAKLPGNPTGPALFHLTTDPAEKSNLASEYPERVGQMMAMVKRTLEAIGEQKIPLGESVAKAEKKTN